MLGNEEASVRSAEPGEDSSSHSPDCVFACRWREQCPTQSLAEDSYSTPVICLFGILQYQGVMQLSSGAVSTATST